MPCRLSPQWIRETKLLKNTQVHFTSLLVGRKGQTFRPDPSCTSGVAWIDSGCWRCATGCTQQSNSWQLVFPRGGSNHRGIRERVPYHHVEACTQLSQKQTGRRFSLEPAHVAFTQRQTWFPLGRRETGGASFTRRRGLHEPRH
jgi:hypothetical protein